MEMVVNPVALPHTAAVPSSEMLAMEAAPQAENLNANVPQEQPMIIQWGMPGQGGGGSDLMATGLGGGDPAAKGTGDVAGMGGAEVVPNPLSLLPEPTPQPQDKAPVLSADEGDGTGLILGLRSAEDVQNYNQAVMDEIDNNLSHQSNRQASSAPYLRWIQFGLAIIALITGGLALSMWRKLHR